MTIKFSVLVPVYNVEAYLESCVQSILKQTYAAYEIILVDDGSTDSSGIICDKFASMYDNIKVFHKENRGLIHTRRMAIEKASGDYYVMLDSDDLLSLNTLERLYFAISQHSCDCVVFNRKLLDKERIILPQYHFKEEYVTDKRNIVRKLLIESPYNAFVLKCAKASMYTGMDFTKYYHIQKGEDLLQSLELINNCRTVEFIDDPLYIYRIRAGSLTKQEDTSIPLVDFTVRQMTLQYIYKWNVFTKEDLQEYRNKCIILLVNQIIDICSRHNTFKEKKNYFMDIRKSTYYKSFLSHRISDVCIGRRKYIYVLFKWHLDKFNILLIQGYRRSKQSK